MKRLPIYKSALASALALAVAVALCPPAVLTATAVEGPQPGPLPDAHADAHTEPSPVQTVSAAGSSRYFLTNLGQATTAKIQKPWGACWAFAVAGAIESAILKAEATAAGQDQQQLPATSAAFAAPDLANLPTAPDVSERAIAWFAHEPQSEASGGVQAGEGFFLTEAVPEEQLSAGNSATAAAALTAWQSLVSEAAAPYEYNGYSPGVSEAWYGSNPAFDACQEDWSLPDGLRTVEDTGWRVSEVLRLQSPANVTADGTYTGYTAQATDAIKRTLVDVGAVAVALAMEQNIPTDVWSGNSRNAEPSESFTFSTWSQYSSAPTVAQNHAALIVGWDDAYPAANFQGTESGRPPADGAWLCKNSWGNDGLFASLGGEDEATRWGLTDANGQASGYFWLSYYDHAIADVEAFAVTPVTESADALYQHDYLGAAEYVVPVKYSTHVQAANVFTAEDTQLLEAVTAWTFETDAGCSVTVGVLPPGFDAATASPDELMAASVPAAHAGAAFTDAGFHTLELDTPVLVTAGQQFTLTLEISADASGFNADEGQVNEGAGTYLGLEVAYLDPAGQTTAAACVANAGETFVNVGAGWQTVADLNAGRAAERARAGQEADFVYGNAIVKGLAMSTTMADPSRVYQVVPLTAV